MVELFINFSRFNIYLCERAVELCVMMMSEGEAVRKKKGALKFHRHSFLLFPRSLLLSARFKCLVIVIFINDSREIKIN
jgi:hypothetical protein